jgi:hypothetical protein
MTEHSKLGASSAKRWTTCPGSVRLCDAVMVDASEYANEGTAAHTVVSQSLRTGQQASQFLGCIVANDVLLKIPVTEGVLVTQEMVAAVTVFTDAVRELTVGFPQRELSIEVRFHLTALHPDLWGTADVAIYDPDTFDLWVMDYKHGAGVLVAAIDNLQIRYYALGAAFAKDNRRVDQVHVAIVQPRIGSGAPAWDHVDSVDLLEFGAWLQERALATEDPDAPLVVGEHCRGTWCPAAAFCPALREATDAVALPRAKSAVSGTTLLEILKVLPLLKGRVKAMEEMIATELRKGTEIPERKIVAKAGKRYFVDEAGAERVLLSEGFAEDEILKPADLKGIGDIEALLGKKRFAEMLADYVGKTSPGTEYAPLTDARDPVSENLLAKFSPVV